MSVIGTSTGDVVVTPAALEPIIQPTHNIPLSLARPQYQGPQDPDHEFWWQATGTSLQSLLESCRYDAANQAAHLAWYRRFIIPALGPRPRPGVEPAFKPCPTADGSACELSINWAERRQQRIVRFTIEATDAAAGTPADPFNQEATLRLLRGMASDMPGSIDLERFEHFVRGFFLLDADAARAVLPRLPAGAPRSQAWVAFDLLPSGRVMAKVYFMPLLKCIQVGTPANRLVRDVIASARDGHGGFSAPLDIFERYTQSFANKRNGPKVEMIAIDCVDSPASRIKMYLRTSVTTLAGARDAYTLGGRLDGEAVEAGLEAMGQLWRILFRLDTHGDIDDVEVLPAGSYCGFAVEMKPGRARPEVKMHIPVRKIEGTDAQLIESLSSWFRCQGDGEFASSYRGYLEKAFPRHDLNGMNGTHTFVSFAYTAETGVYMTMYYSTKIFGSRVQDIWKGYDDLWATERTY
ncbi:7-dimethylallyltryptophan synthase [Madurella mycetomatis]|uniref:7-dimethylallyltryptophan synthase n=1 Tax=Madurella mycetomatis TaxID=100816 RepID=A0A175W9J0_9PEZI|nr:7-dimethylallyltryptophan synthase [Madurella mycetomatis]KXX79960.1 7-dimethylallyltryptophan synthase [Madurella mycetomatis]